MRTMRRISNPHNRPMQLDLTMIADSRADLIHRLRSLADQIEWERMLMTPLEGGSGGGNGDDFEMMFRAKLSREDDMQKQGKIHFRQSHSNHRGGGQTEHEASHSTACGFVRDSVTTQPEKVSCKLCLREMRK